MTNCIIAKFEQGSYHAKRVYGLTQWDVGQYLKVVGLSLPENAEIHFSLEDSIGRAERVETLVKDGVAICKIPQYILENESAASDYSAYVWVYLRGSDSGETIGKTILHIRTRPKPSDYVYTDEDVLNYEKLKEELEEKIAEIAPTEEETLVMLAETDIVDIVTDANGDIFTDANGNIIVF